MSTRHLIRSLEGTGHLGGEEKSQPLRLQESNKAGQMNADVEKKTRVGPGRGNQISDLTAEERLKDTENR